MSRSVARLAVVVAAITFLVVLVSFMRASELGTTILNVLLYVAGGIAILLTIFGWKAGWGKSTNPGVLFGFWVLCLLAIAGGSYLLTVMTATVQSTYVILAVLGLVVVLAVLVALGLVIYHLVHYRAKLNAAPPPSGGTRP